MKEMAMFSTSQACDTIKQAADNKMDEDIQMLIRGVSNDLIAAQAKYHKSCYAEYLHAGPKESNLETPYTIAFNQLISDLTLFIKAGKAFTMASLLTKYKDTLEKMGVASRSYSSQRLKVRLQKHFKNEIVFHQQSHRRTSELLYSSSISLESVINSAYMKSPLGSKSDDSDAIPAGSDERTRLLYRVAKLIKGDITDCQGIPIRPPNLHDLTLISARSLIPESLYWILRWIISNPSSEEDEFTSPRCNSKTDEKRILMLAQDVVHCASHSRIKMPKHVSLAISLRHLTGSKQLVTMLSRMGHCSSYDEVEIIDTSLAREILA